MNTAFLIAIALCGCSQTLTAFTIEPPRQRGEIRCEQSLSLKDVFDAGFRPYGVIESTCTVGKSDVTLVVPPSDRGVQLEVEMMSFKVSRYDTLKGIDIRTAAAPVKQTGGVLRQLASSLGVSLQGLDEAIARATPANPESSETWTQDWANEWLSIRLAFQPLTYFQDDASNGYREMKSHAVLSIEWKPTEVDPTYREKPIAPPRGYEHVSMEIPGSDLVKKAQTTDDPALAHLRYPDEKQRQAILATPPQTVPEPRTKQPAPAKKALEAKPTPSPNDEPASSTPWSTIAVLIVAATGLLGLLLKKRKRPTCNVL